MSSMNKQLLMCALNLVVQAEQKHKRELEMPKPVKPKNDQVQYDLFMTCACEELKRWYDACHLDYGYRAAMIKAIADLRGFDTSDWAPFYR